METELFICSNCSKFVEVEVDSEVKKVFKTCKFCKGVFPLTGKSRLRFLRSR